MHPSPLTMLKPRTFEPISGTASHRRVYPAIVSSITVAGNAYGDGVVGHTCPVRCNPSVSLGGVVVQAAASRGGIGVGEEERPNRAVVRVSVHVKAGSAQRGPWSPAAA
ncbi:hypothetical protein ACSQ67_010503 [Phaseolus vulgaris]